MILLPFIIGLYIGISFISFIKGYIDKEYYISNPFLYIKPKAFNTPFKIIVPFYALGIYTYKLLNIELY